MRRVLLSISIISHGHGAHVHALLQLLAQQGATPLQRVWLTLNVPEPALADAHHGTWPFDLRVLHNTCAQGFGVNHNKAFTLEQQQPEPAAWFAVLNPDLTWATDPLPWLLECAALPACGCAYPVQVDSAGKEQDHRRMVPTPLQLLTRHALGQRTAAPEPDWVNAAMLVFPAQVYAAVGGFDERYFLYCEDVDLCLRLRLAGYHLTEARSAVVIHLAQRGSHQVGQHLWWHLSGLWRLWTSAPFWRYRQLQRNR